MMSEQLLTTYSFFAALTENSTDIYRTVYIPICKRALSLYAKKESRGSDQDIRNIISDEYGINVPLLIIRKLIKSVVNDLSRKDKSKFDFQIVESGNNFFFSFKSFSFSNIENSYEAERRKTNALQQAFETFTKESGDKVENIPTFSEFINKNKNRISSFLSGRVSDIININDSARSFLPHVRFLQYIEQYNDVLYSTTKQIFIGSVIASYLESELDLDAKMERGTSYYLDTQIVLELLDLQRSEDTLPTKELVNLIHETGGNVRIMSITLEEIRTSIENAIHSYDRKAPTSTINEACERLKKNKTWLINLNGKLEEILTKDYKINIDKVSDNYINEISVSDDAKILKEIRYKKNTALHDVVAYMFVREKRKHDSNKKLLQKASYWFITANKKLCEFNIAKKINGNAPEIILPEELTSLLFLQNPIKYSGKVSSIGLNELIAQTLSEEYPSRDIINEFDEAISTINDITNDDYKILLSSISQESTINIQRLLHTSNSQPAEFNKAIHSIIEKERNNKLETDNKHKAEIQRNKELQKDNESLSKRLSAISQQIANIQEQQRLDKQSEVENKKRNRRNNIMYISIIISLVSIIILQIFPNIIFWLKTCIQVIGGLGGLWGFCNLLLNLYSKFK